MIVNLSAAYFTRCTCPACNGAGYVDIEPPEGIRAADRRETCAECEGEGEVEIDTELAGEGEGE